MRYQEYRENNKSFVDEVEAARQHTERFVRRLEGATKRSTKRFLIEKFLTSSEVKLHFFFHSASRKKLLANYPPEVMRAEAHSLDAFAHDEEAIGFYTRPETVTRKARPLTIFGPRKHALQNMVRSVLGAIHPSRPNQYTIKGGVPAALTAVEQDMKDGYIHAMELDIGEFYRNIRFDGLANLLRPLPRRVVENVVWNPRRANALGTDELSTGVSHDGLLPSRGLPQGSASSPIAAEVVVGSLLAGMPSNVRCRTYADNILILGLTQDDVEAASLELEALATACEAGPLELKRGPLENLETHNCHFLGYAGLFRRIGPIQHIEWQPKHGKLDAIEIVIQNPQSTQRQLIEAHRWVRAAPRAYKLWNDGQRWSAQAQCEIHAKLAYKTRENLSLIQHCRIIFEHWRHSLGFTREFQLLLPEASPQEENRRQEVIDTLNRWANPNPDYGLEEPPVVAPS